LSQPWGSQLVTGEAVELDLRPAALPSRVVAGLLDATAQAVLLFGLLLAAAAGTSQASEAAGAAISIVVIMAVLVGYPVIFETLLRGRTPGKMAMGLRVVRDDGGPIGFRHAFVRGLTGAFVERPGITLFVAGVVTSLLNPQSKRIGDLLAGTIVLQERVAARGGQVATMPPPLAGWAVGLDLSGLPDDLALSARQFLARSADLTPQAREQLGARLVAAVTSSISPPPPLGTPGWAVLSAVLAERRRREELRLGQRRAQQAPPPGASVGNVSPWAGPTGPAPVPPGARPVPRPERDEPPTTGPGGFVVPS
jgi:uncharacterized RDD family membrane protein YckC